MIPDINECAVADVCGDALFVDRCANEPGSYTCECKANGQLAQNKSASPCSSSRHEPKLSFRTCVNRNECADLGRQLCPTRSVCRDTYGSYECDCVKGFKPETNEHGRVVACHRESK